VLNLRGQDQVQGPNSIRGANILVYGCLRRAARRPYRLRSRGSCGLRKAKSDGLVESTDKKLKNQKPGVVWNLTAKGEDLVNQTTDTA